MHVLQATPASRVAEDGTTPWSLTFTAHWNHLGALKGTDAWLPLPYSGVLGLGCDQAPSC